MTNQQIEKLIRKAEAGAFSRHFVLARLAGGIALLLPLCAPLFSLPEEGIVLAVLLAIAGGAFAWSNWRDGKAIERNFNRNRAQSTWVELTATDIFGEDTYALRAMLHRVGAVYESDPDAKVFPLLQAVQLVQVWHQQQSRLALVRGHVAQMGDLHVALLQKQAQLRALGDDNAGIEQTLARLEADIGPLERSSETLRASCARLEAIVLSVDAAAQRRQLLREVGELTAGVHRDSGSAIELHDEHLDLERQIGREIETFLQLERETDAHLREL